MPRPSVVLIVEDEPDLADQYAAWLDDDYEVRSTIDAETAREEFDASVDVVLLDRQLPDASGAGLLGRLRARDGDFAAAMITGIEPDFRVLQLDVDEYVTKPVERDELRALVERLTDRRAVEEAVDGYLSLLAKKRASEADSSHGEPASDSRSDSSSGELLARRRQIESLLVRLGTPADESSAMFPDDEGRVDGTGETGAGEPPLYRSRPTEFYGLWLLAALTYGVGDVVSTLYAVLGVTGIDEANPVVGSLLTTFGIPGFLLLKFLVFLVLISVSVQGARTVDRFSYYWPPVVMALLGVGLTAWNLTTIAGAG
ncbi:response regulator transcription factor [Halorubrum sp. AJ67]|uniref:response regulator transcription factor n=1 Tax=Halorubrum sp. AJ67 TaxID=1173487 RepID=UPI0003DBE55D|nr:response regulator [Halorubrum sp. AJ67]CDK39296.1 response regulator [Halorubrum sp. AJ67]